MKAPNEPHGIDPLKGYLPLCLSTATLAFPEARLLPTLLFPEYYPSGTSHLAIVNLQQKLPRANPHSILHLRLNPTPSSTTLATPLATTSAPVKLQPSKVVGSVVIRLPWAEQDLIKAVDDVVRHPHNE